ncbi:MAG: YbgC/FadM family acyl-CoA thioesterase [Proteobacteria bacterium]|nr:YbgC/FadM family acyl-CoA thioesterase [Pseudomonadota bacterium]
MSQTVESFGQFVGKVHVLPIRIYYEDTDLSGIVYHANYLRFMERGRTEFFRAAGIHKLADLDGPEPFAWTLRKAALDYMRPARLNDLIEVHTSATALSGVRMTASQDIYCDGRQLTHGTVEACIISLSGKPKRIPEETRAKLLPYLLETGA